MHVYIGGRIHLCWIFNPLTGCEVNIRSQTCCFLYDTGKNKNYIIMNFYLVLQILKSSIVSMGFFFITMVKILISSWKIFIYLHFLKHAVKIPSQFYPSARGLM